MRFLLMIFSFAALLSAPAFSAALPNAWHDQGTNADVSYRFHHDAPPPRLKSALLSRYGTHPNLHLVLFTLDESTYARELAPLAGHYPAVRLGRFPPGR